MPHPPTTTKGRRWRLPALLAVGVLLPWSLLGCSSGDDSSSTTETTPVTASNGGDTEELAAACREADLSAIEEAAGRFVTAQAAADAVSSEAEATSAIVSLLDAGSVLFSTMASSLDDLFTALADAAGQPGIAEVPDSLRTAADDFSTLATDISDAGTIDDADIARIDEISAQFDELDSAVASESEGGQQLRRVPACETFIRNFEAVFAGLEGTDSSVDDSTDGMDMGENGVNSDPADGVCDQDRWLQDPDCGNPSVMNSDLADDVCDESRFFTDPDC